MVNSRHIQCESHAVRYGTCGGSQRYSVGAGGSSGFAHRSLAQHVALGARGGHCALGAAALECGAELNQWVFPLIPLTKGSQV